MPPAAKYALSYVFVQAEFGALLPGEHDRLRRAHAREFGARELVARYLPELDRAPTSTS